MCARAHSTLWPDDPAAMREAALAFDLKHLEPRFLDDPFPLYRALREHDPIHLMPDGSYFLSRYDDCVAVYHDQHAWSSDKRVDFRPNFGKSLLYEHHTTSLVFNDPPYHTRVRKLLAPAFTPRALRALQPRVEALVDHLLDDAAARGTIDLIDDFASAIPVQLIGDMLGVPQDERGPLRGWSLAILGALEPVLSPAQFERGVTSVGEFKDYLVALIGRRLAEGRREESEILSTLIAASAFDPANAAEERLSEVELLHNCIFLLNAGHETTTNLIGNTVDALLRFPDELRRLKDKPELLKSCVEEGLRFESSNQLGNRRLAEDLEVGGERLAAGTYIHIGIGAANRDPAQFADPDRFDAAREPNRHVAFGSGMHVCLGAVLARLEGTIAIGRLIRRFDGLARAGPLERGGRARFRGFNRYPISWARSVF
jgi:cytochrome P450